MLAEAGLQLPHLVFMRWMNSLFTLTPRIGSDFAMSGNAGVLTRPRYHPSSTALL
jgi:hypothetical protein